MTREQYDFGTDKDDGEYSAGWTFQQRAGFEKKSKNHKRTLYKNKIFSYTCDMF